MTMYSFRKVLDEGSSSPLIARLFFGIIELRDLAAMGGIEESERAQFKHAFDSRFEPIFQACLASRDAALEVIRLVVSHKTNIESGRIVKPGDGNYQILESIDKELGQSVDKLLDQGVIASKTALQKMLSDVMGIEVGFLYKKDLPFQEGMDGLLREGQGNLAEYLVAVRGSWLSSLQELRNKHEHHGWTLSRCDYHMGTPGHVEIELPRIDGLEVQVWAPRIANCVLLFVEEMLAYALARRTRHPLFITEIPAESRDPRDVKRFRPAATGLDDSPPWAITFKERRDFI